MPTLPAASYPTQLLPEVQPSISPPTGFEQARATPEAFGGGIARATSQLGDTLAKAALERQEFINKTTADQQTNAYQEAETKIQFGDPDNPTDTGFYGKRGQDAIDAFPEARKTLIDLRNNMSAGLNPATRLLFDGETRRLQSYTLARMGMHFDQQYEAHATQVSKARVDNSLTAAANSIANDDDAGWQANTGSAMRAALDGLKISGADKDPDIVNNTLQKIRGDAVKYKAEAIARKDPDAAQQFLQNNSDAMERDEFNTLMGRYNAAARTVQADRAWRGEPIGGTSTVTGEGSSDPIERFLDLARMDESGGRNIRNFMFDPRHTAQGYYQITDTTWRQFAPGAGVDLSEYPHAMAAPEEVQRNVARQIATQSGVQHWTLWNPTLLNHVTQLGLPTVGPLPKGFKAPDVPTATVYDQAGNEHRLTSEQADEFYKTPGFEGQQAYLQKIGAPSTPTSGPDEIIQQVKPLPRLNFALPELEPGETPDNQVPGMSQALENIIKTVPEDNVLLRQQAVKQARRELNAQYQDQQRAYKLHKEQSETQARSIQDDYFSRLGKGEPITTGQILTDSRLHEHPEIKENIVNFLNRLNQEDPAASVSKTNLMNLVGAMNAPDGTPGKIYDEQPIIDAFTKGALTRTDFGFAQSQFRALHGPEGQVFKMQAEFVKAQEHKITGGPGLAQFDENAGVRKFNYNQYVGDKIKEYQKAGKNPTDLFREDNKDYVGSPAAMKPFMPTQTDIQGATDKAFGGMSDADLEKMSESELQSWMRSQSDPLQWDRGAALAVRKFGKQPMTPQAPPAAAPVR